MEPISFRLILKYLRGILFFFGMPALLFLIAGTVNWWQGWVYISITYVASIISRAIMTKIHPDLIKERVNYSEKKDAKPWDKVLMPLVALISPAAYFITAGFDKRFGWSGEIPLWLYIPALVIILGGLAFSTWALATNRFFSAVVRIQTDRGHTVVDSGPYQYVRHPGYLSGMVVALMFPLMIGSWWAYIPVVIMCILIVVRTALEDKTLAAELPGYVDYSAKTKFRLLYGVW